MRTFAQLVKSNQDPGEVLLNHQHCIQLPSGLGSYQQQPDNNVKLLVKIGC